MDIRLLTEDDIPQAKTLWKAAFCDSDQFIDWYFDNKVLPGHSLGLFGRGLVSVVHMIPYAVRVQGKMLESAMIAGVATAANRRGEGLMKALLLESLALLKTRGILMTHLYPVRHAFYERFGWKTFSYVHKQNVGFTAQRSEAQVIETTDWRMLDTLYMQMMQSFDGYVIRGWREWRWRLDELAADGGKTAALIKNGEVCAYMLYFRNEKKTDVIETVYVDAADIQTLLSAIQHGGRTEYWLPAECETGSAPHAMARVVDAKALIELFEAQALLENVHIVDDFAAWNNIGGQAGRRGLHVGDLAKIVHRGLSTEQLRQYNIEGDIFMRQKTCIFEAY